MENLHQKQSQNGEAGLHVAVFELLVEYLNLQQAVLWIFFLGFFIISRFLLASCWTFCSTLYFYIGRPIFGKKINWKDYGEWAGMLITSYNIH